MSEDKGEAPNGATDADSEPRNERFSDAIFSTEETVSIVKGFILAYMRGTLTVRFPSVKEEISMAESKGKPIDEIKATKNVLDRFNSLEDRCGICLGTIQSTPEQRQEAVKTLADTIIRLRSTNRITGTFMDFATEDRIKQLGTEVEAINNLLAQFINLFRSGANPP